MSTTLLIIITYLVATLWEQYFHRDILHASSKVLKRWKSSEFVIYKMLYRGYYGHHVVHHKKTFTKAYTEQFDSKEEKERLDSFLIEKFGGSDDDQDYGLTINDFNSYFMFMFPLIILSPILLYLLEMYEFVIVTVVMMLPLLLSKYIHPLLHGEIKDNWFYNNAYIKLIYNTHYIHHQDDSKNFNLLWGGDWLRGSYVAPSKFRRSESPDSDNGLR